MDRVYKFILLSTFPRGWNPAAVHILFCKTTVWHPIIFMFVSGKFGFTLLLICAGIFGGGVYYVARMIYTF